MVDRKHRSTNTSDAILWHAKVVHRHWLVSCSNQTICLQMLTSWICRLALETCHARTRCVSLAMAKKRKTARLHLLLLKSEAHHEVPLEYAEYIQYLV